MKKLVSEIRFQVKVAIKAISKRAIQGYVGGLKNMYTN